MQGTGGTCDVGEPVLRHPTAELVRVVWPPEPNRTTQQQGENLFPAIGFPSLTHAGLSGFF